MPAKGDFILRQAFSLHTLQYASLWALPARHDQPVTTAVMLIVTAQGVLLYVQLQILLVRMTLYPKLCSQ